MKTADVVAPSPWARYALLVAALLAGWCAIRGAANELWSGADPGRAALFWPASGDALAAIAQRRIVAAGGRVDAGARALVRTALRRAPRSADPLVLAGLAASDDGDLARAERLMVAARARDPRATIARSWLLDHYLRTGNYAAGLDEVGAELRLRPDSQAPILAILSALLATPQGMAALRGALVREPDWRMTLFATAPQYGADPAALAALLASIPPARDPAAAATEQSAVLRAMIDRGAYAGAYRTWRGFLPPRYRASVPGIYDPDFAGWPGPAPFTWVLQAGPASVARVAPLAGGRHALTLAFGDDTAAVLAEQYALVDPGAYMFSLVARQIGHGPTRLAARLVCASDAGMIATVALDNLLPRFAAYRAPADVPARCGALRVQFVGAPGEERGAASVQVAAVRLVRR